MKKILIILALLIGETTGYGQSYNLQQLLKDNKLDIQAKNVGPLNDGDKKAVSNDGICWLKGVIFSNGTIEVDLRGKDKMQGSFLGIAFHGADTGRFDLVYFRPFNFRSTDPIRKIHAVQYTSEPDFPWHRLREEKNGIYEKAVTPAPAATDWFHAKIVVDDKTITVYVDHSTTPSLIVEKLNDRTTGMIGIWSSKGALPGEYANLVIKGK